MSRSTVDTERAKRRRLELVHVLSPDGKCACCENVFDARDLTIDHIDGRTWNLRKMNAWRRVALYWREYHAGVRLRALCNVCNCTLGSRDKVRGVLPRYAT